MLETLADGGDMPPDPRLQGVPTESAESFRARMRKLNARYNAQFLKRKDWQVCVRLRLPLQYPALIKLLGMHKISHRMNEPWGHSNAVVSGLAACCLLLQSNGGTAGCCCCGHADTCGPVQQHVAGYARNLSKARETAFCQILPHCGGTSPGLWVLLFSHTQAASSNDEAQEKQSLETVLCVPPRKPLGLMNFDLIGSLHAFSLPKLLVHAVWMCAWRRSAWRR